MVHIKVSNKSLHALLHLPLKSMTNGLLIERSVFKTKTAFEVEGVDGAVVVGA